MQKISVVLPVYRNANTLPELAERLTNHLKSNGFTPEIIFVCDGSPDNSWSVIQQLKKQYPEIIGLNLSRNFGQHNAITAGIDACTGDYAVVMDADLQDRPEEIAEMYKKSVAEKADVVLGVRKVRNDGFFKKLGSRLFYKLFNFAVGVSHDYNVGNFGLYSKKVYLAVRELKEQNKFFPLNVLWLGFDTAKHEVQHDSRREGVSSYSISRLLKLAYKIVINHTNRPLYLCIFAGLIISTLSISVGGFYFIRAFIENNPAVIGWASLIVSIHFLSGIILLSTGIIGIYLGNVFNEVKRRPIYVIKDRS